MNNNFSYAIFPLKLITDEKYKGLSSDDKILYALLLNRKNYSKKNLKSFSDEKGIFVYYPNLQIQQHLSCSTATAIKALKNLENAGLITKEYQKRGLPLKIYVNDITCTYPKPKAEQSPTPYDVSFSVEKAELRSKVNRGNFGEIKNKKRRSHKTTTF